MRKIVSLFRPVLAVLALAGLAPNGYSAVIQYLDRTQWESAVVVAQTVTFSNISPKPSVGSSLARSGVAGAFVDGNTTVRGFTSGGSLTYYVRNPAAGEDYDYGSGVVALTASNGFTTPARFRIDFATPVLGVGLSVMTHEPAADMVYIALNGGTPYTVQATGRPYAQFWGARSDTPISYIEVYSRTYLGTTLIDNISSAAVINSEAPEASTWLLAGGGLLAMGLWGRKHIKGE